MQQQPECTEHEPAQGDNGVFYCGKCGVILPAPERPRRKRVERAEEETKCDDKLTIEQRVEILENSIRNKTEPTPAESKPKIKLPMNPLLKWALIVVAAIVLINVAQVMLCGYQIGG